VVMSVTWKQWKEARETYFNLPEDPSCIKEKDMEKCEIEGCERWCSTLTQCSLHAQMDMRSEDE